MAWEVPQILPDIPYEAVTADDLIATLPYRYDTGADSNFAKLMRVLYKPLYSILPKVKILADGIDLRTATGEYLDIIGGNYGITRNSNSDDQYRLRITAKIVAMFTGGEQDSLSKMSENTLGLPTVVINANWAEMLANRQSLPAAFEAEPAACYIVLPFEVATDEDVQKMIFLLPFLESAFNSVKPAGVKLILSLTGSFKYSEDEFVKPNSSDGFDNGVLGTFI